MDFQQVVVIVCIWEFIRANVLFLPNLQIPTFDNLEYKLVWFLYALYFRR